MLVVIQVKRGYKITHGTKCGKPYLLMRMLCQGIYLTNYIMLLLFARRPMCQYHSPSQKVRVFWKFKVPYRYYLAHISILMSHLQH
jgi:hypothetical protein